ncbi:2Fe-2S iron-sulfur cluster-binding protein [Amycolatopsis rhabdoformis]|uniref:2Fe-2S iron-sulfur cluster-binding protein n=1 Tax=Amycolatopsis rhabdoformis TaxID=1448059 RepID=A0ABZ1IEZ1_9PSEU|nr:2Fe-2S iron-sulfur cluster-binding protein [Amycolatopsis rhabdoformis]WSE32492.1 2Fe-2S iron-sulfur cluster-binding protein [Amycolatopsis rhabdoformis]
MKIVYALTDGTEQTVDAEPRTTVMQAAIEANVPGIVAECGGNAMCATCHVFVEPGAAERFGEVSADEDEMLDCTAAERTELSRLSCQLVPPDDGTVTRVTVPDRQR